MNMFRLFRRRTKRSKGFTLTELIVVVAVMAIIMATVVAFATPIRGMVRNTDARSDATVINPVIGNYIERRLAYANDVDVYVGCDFVTGSGADHTALNASFTKLEGYAAATTVVNEPRIMVFKFEKNSTDSLKNTFKVYDAPVKGTDKVSDYKSVAQDKYLVFTDDFYGGYQYFFTIDDTAKSFNTLKKKAYLSLRVDSYNCTGDSYDSSGNALGLTEEAIQNYRKDISEGKNPSEDDKALLLLTREKTGSENISFQLENIHDPDKISIQYGKSGGSGALSDYGTDIYIFYNVRQYKNK